MSSVALQLMAMGINDVFNFDFMDKPSEDHLKDAFHQLAQLGAITQDMKQVRTRLCMGKVLKLEKWGKKDFTNEIIVGML